MASSLPVTPTLPLLGLTEDERELMQRLDSIAVASRHGLAASEAYYLGEQIVENLRIAIPKQLEFIRPTLGWAAMAVDPYVERLNVDGFRLPGATDADASLGGLLAEVGFEALQSLAYTDALSMGRSYWCVGSPAERGGAPLVTVESPLNVAVLWDRLGVNPRAVKMEYIDEHQRRRGALMVPGKTIQLAQDEQGDKWEVVERDDHGFPFVPIVRMANRPRTHARDGRSEISPALRYLIQSACRTMLGLEVSREFYSVPQKVILGASEADFVKSDGTPKSAWETYITNMLALERDENGELPQIHQTQAYDPSVFTKVLDWLASSAAGIVAATPQDMGLYTQGNPASAEAVEAGEARRDRRAVNMQHQWSPDLVRVAQMVLRFDGGGELPAQYRRIAPDWSDVTPPNPQIVSDAVAKEVAAGAVPATSDVTLKRLGYSAIERRRLEQDRKTEQGRTAAESIIEAVTSRRAPVEADRGDAGI